MCFHCRPPCSLHHPPTTPMDQHQQRYGSDSRLQCHIEHRLETGIRPFPAGHWLCCHVATGQYHMMPFVKQLQVFIHTQHHCTRLKGKNCIAMITWLGVDKFPSLVLNLDLLRSIVYAKLHVPNKYSINRAQLGYRCRNAFEDTNRQHVDVIWPK